MANKTISVLGKSLLALGFVIGALQSCGGGSSSSDYASLCMKGCAMTVSCEADAGVTVTQSQCEQTCTSQAAKMKSCTNQTAIINALNACLADTDCTTFDNCFQTVPACQGGSGTGGTSGGNGTGGAGGAGAPDCSICDKASTCCTALAALGGSTNTDCAAFSTSMCSTSGQDESLEAQACASILASGAADNLAACK